MNILTLNAGSSSLKFKLFEELESIESGLIENIGETDGEYANHGEALNAVNAMLQDRFPNLNIELICHRVVHGGDIFSKPLHITPESIIELKSLIPLAPLHNPANILGIETAIKCYPNAKQVAIFDTAFHANMPEAAFTYAIDQATAKEHHIRKYGFHGTSHQYVSERAANLLKKPHNECQFISLHLGNGASACAIKNGISIDTSMGMTPIAGLCMGTRCGDIDPAIPLIIAEKTSPEAADKLLNKESGLKGICGDNDMRRIEARAKDGNKAAKLAIDVFVYRIQSTIGSYLSQLPNCDALIFTGGIGENSQFIRDKVCQNLKHLGIGSNIKVLVVETDEELQMAKLAYSKLTPQD